MEIKKAKRVVIKIGSALITREDNGELREKWMQTLVDDIAAMLKRGQEVVVVSSGAVALGRKMIDMRGKTLRLEEKQAAAACGQTELVRHYKQCFSKHKRLVGQVLLTLQDIENRRHYLNAKNTIETLLSAGVVPVINENDTVATQELRFGDNDRLAAKVAQMISADVLVLLSDVDGLYTANPKLYPAAEHCAEIREITKKVKSYAGGALSSVGSGGMATKVLAAEIAMQGGCHTVIALGTEKHPLKALEAGARCTWFVSHETPLSARKQWIASSLNIKGEIVIDDGALRALIKGKSLLPAGVIDIKGKFGRGQAVVVKDCRMREVARGLSAYSSRDAKLIKGHHSSEIENITGFAGRMELIHRDDLVLTHKDEEDEGKNAIEFS